MSEPAGDHPAPGITLADKLNWLFDQIRPDGPEGVPYTSYGIANKINAGNPFGVTISGQYVIELRQGVAPNPRLFHLKALAWAFGVDPRYLVDDEVSRQVMRDIDLLHELKEMGVQEVALRTVLRDSGLGEESVALVQNLVRQLKSAAEQPSDDQDPA